MCDLGTAYYKGGGVQRNYRIALECFLSAAEQGNVLYQPQNVLWKYLMTAAKRIVFNEDNTIDVNLEEFEQVKKALEFVSLLNITFEEEAIAVDVSIK